MGNSKNGCFALIILLLLGYWGIKSCFSTRETNPAQENFELGKQELSKKNYISALNYFFKITSSDPQYSQAQELIVAIRNAERAEQEPTQNTTNSAPSSQPEITLSGEEQKKLKNFQEKWVKQIMKDKDYESYFSEYEITAPNAITFYLGRTASQTGSMTTQEQNIPTIESLYNEASQKSGITTPAIHISFKPMKGIETLTQDYTALGLKPAHSEAGVKLYDFKDGKALYWGKILTYNSLKDVVNIEFPSGKHETKDAIFIEEHYYEKKPENAESGGRWHPAYQFLQEGVKLYLGNGNKKTFYGRITNIEEFDSKNIITIILANGEVENLTEHEIKKAALYVHEGAGFSID